MRSSVGLCVLGLLCLHRSVFGQALDVQPGVLIFCDDASVETAVNSAVNKFNERLSTGHKLALFQILTASKSENGSDSVYSLKFTGRRSDCQAGSSKPWRDCDYLSYGHKEPFSCSATVYMTETDADTKQVDCLHNDAVIPDKAACLGCPVEIDGNADDLKTPLLFSISKYNSMSDSTHLFNLHRVGYATRQVVAGFRYKLRFDMKRTTCAKAEHKDINDLCVPDDENMEFANCNSTVDVAPWRFESPQAHINCEAGLLSPSLFTRRRPAGWSPLRNILFEVTSSSTSPPPSSVPPTKASVKKESSEEDTTASKLTTPPDVASEDVIASLFHCPSKPWKPFNPVDSAAPTKAATEEAPLPPSADGTFMDTDLIA